jgi:GntR family transcriptional regulator
LDKTIDPTSYKPLYLQISEILRNQINAGAYCPGDLLPSENDLLDRFPVSRNTAQRAIEDLVRDGLAIRIQGKGTYVPKSLVNFGLHRLTSFSEEMRFKGLTPSSKILKFEKIKPVETIAKKLNLNPDEKVYNLVRIRYGDEHPMAIQDSSLPTKHCPGLENYDFSVNSLFNVLETDYHLHISWQSQNLKPCNARIAEAQALTIEVGTPLLYLDGVAYLERDIPIEYKTIYYRSDLYDFSMRSIRK